ncbi:MAG: hypothetical protein EBV23_06815, partial [Flavobacteriia bacterium]|nr:hypothetical protein [Flavobacteriia bacterium]
MKYYLLSFIPFLTVACYSQQVVDTIPDLRKIITNKVISYQVKPDVDGAFNIALGSVYETMVVSKKDLPINSMRKFTKLLFKQSSYEVISYHALPQASNGKMCATQKDATTNAMESTTLNNSSASNHDNDSSSKTFESNVADQGNVRVSSKELVPVPFNIEDLASGGVSNRYTHIVNIEGERYVSASLCFNTSEKSVRIYAYVKPKNILQNVGPGNPYTISGKLSKKAAAKIAKIL